MNTFTTADGVGLAYDVQGSGPTVVLINGFAAARGTWALQQTALVDAGFTVVSVDRRHHGDSDFPDHGLRLARHGADLHELLAGLALGPAHLVGASMGASSIWALVDLFGTDGLASVTCVDQTPRMINDESWDLGFYDLTWATLDAFIRDFPGGLNPFHAPPPAEAMAVIGAHSRLDYPLESVKPLLRDHAVQDWRDVIGRIDVPLLAVGGRHSPLWPVAGQEWIAAAAPRGELAIMEDSGHIPFLSEPEAFNAALIDFLHRSA